MQSGKAKKQEDIIGAVIQNVLLGGKHSILGNLDYKELALVAEDIPPEVIAKIIKKAPFKLTQKKLINLFTAYSLD